MKPKRWAIAIACIGMAFIVFLLNYKQERRHWHSQASTGNNGSLNVAKKHVDLSVLEVSTSSVQAAKKPELAPLVARPFDTLRVSSCDAPVISKEDTVAYYTWLYNTPEQINLRRIEQRTVAEAWLLEMDKSPEGLFAYSQLQLKCLNAPTSEASLRHKTQFLQSQVKAHPEGGAGIESARELIKHYQQQYLFCAGKSFTMEQYDDNFNRSIRANYIPAIIQLVNKKLDTNDRIDFETSLDFAELLEQNLPQLTATSASVLSRLYLEAGIGEGGTKGQLMRKGMAYYKLEKRLYPTAHIPNKNACRELENIDDRLTVAEIMELEVQAEMLYNKWFRTRL